MELTREEVQRYSRHLKLDGFGSESQLKLKAAKVLLIGAGGLGCPIGLYLAAAGVGEIGVVDDDLVEVHNLQRQIAHKTMDAGRAKVDSLIAAMSALNPLPRYEAYRERAGADNLPALLEPWDLIIDGTDNYPTRYLVADACFFGKKTLIYGAIHRFEAQLSVFVPGQGPCYRCLFPEPPDPELTPSCSAAGVLGVLPGTVGLMMATEAIKLIAGIGRSINGVLVLYSALETSLRKITLGRDKTCPLCGDSPSITHLRVDPHFMRETPVGPAVDVIQARAMVEAGALLVDVRERNEWELCRIEGAVHVALSSLNRESVSTLPRDRNLVVYCHHGVRSKRATNRLRELGFTAAFSMEGGIDSWAETHDPQMARY